MERVYPLLLRQGERLPRLNRLQVFIFSGLSVLCILWLLRSFFRFSFLVLVLIVVLLSWLGLLQVDGSFGFYADPLE